MISSVRPGGQLYAAKQQKPGAVTKATEKSSFETVFKDTYYADSAKGAAASVQTGPAFNLPNTSLSWGLPLREQSKLIDAANGDTAAINKIYSEWHSAYQARVEGTVVVPLGRNELVSFMEEIEAGIASGMTFAEICQQRSDAKVRELYPDDSDVTGVGGDLSDLFFIDPSTGEIKHATSKGRHYYGNDDTCYTDVDAAWDLAYDLQQFLNAKVFRNENFVTEESEAEADRLVAEIKARQTNKDYGRFDRPFGSIGYQGLVNLLKNNIFGGFELSAAQERYYSAHGLLGGGSGGFDITSSGLEDYYNKMRLMGAGSGALTDDFMEMFGRHSDTEYYKKYHTYQNNAARRAEALEDIEAIIGS